MLRTIIALMLASMVSFPGAAQEPPRDFSDAKDTAVDLWWQIGALSFYCHCPYRPATAEEKLIRSGNLWVVGSVCGYQARDLITRKGKPNARTMRIEWEHIVPADWIATGFGCQEANRNDCRQIPGYEEAEGDLFNLVPAIGELNGDRSARPFGIVPSEPREYGACDFEVSSEGDGPLQRRGMAEPMESIRGDIARIWFYMRDRYDIVVPADMVTMLEGWSAADPIDDAEKNRHAEISREMGWKNPFVAGE